MNRLIFTISLASLGTIATLLNSVTQVNAQGFNIGEVEMTATVEGFCLGAPGTPVVVGSTNTETLEIDLAATYDDNLSPGDYS